MTTPILVLVYAAAAMVLLGIAVGIPMWMTSRHPDTAPDTRMPLYLLADWEKLPVQSLSGTDQKPRR